MDVGAFSGPEGPESIQAQGKSRFTRILVVMPNWVGDVVMATPALRALRERFADAHIGLLLKGHLAEISEIAKLWRNTTRQLVVT